LIQQWFEPKAGPLTVQYEPSEHTMLVENPPRFTWMAASWEELPYVLQVSAEETFDDTETITYGPIHYNFYTPDRPFSPGTYYWRYGMWKDGRPSGVWSQVRTFTISNGLPETPLISREHRYNNIRAVEHPRLWLNANEVSALRERIQTDPEGIGWREFYEHSVQPWLTRELIPEPAPYPDHKRVAKLWRQMYMDCQETLYAIRHLSIAGVVLQDKDIIAKAKEWLMHVSQWNPNGTTSRDYNDEAAFRVAGALAWGYDWLYSELTKEEREKIRSVLFQRTEQVAYHVIERSRIHHVPYDSHAVRSLSSVLTPCCIAMLFEEDKAREWLDYAIEYFATIYTPWGGADGGWAEGPMYWTTGMAFVTEALNLIRKFTGINLFSRPFFQKTGDFPLYVFPPDTIRASFCDQSTLGDPPSLKTGTLMRQFAGITGNGMYQWYYEQVSARETIEEANKKFYNYGWWDFRFDELMFRHDYRAPSAASPTNIESVKWFRDIGWVAMHHRMEVPEEHVMLLMKSSKYGSISHSHGDQNAFVLHAYGEPLAIESGYYVAFGSTMHMNWRRQTKSKNALLIDGQGQYAGRDKALNLQASGKVEEAWEREGIGYVRADATAAYRVNNPFVTRCVREIYFINRSYFVVVDSVDLEQPGVVSWLFHSLYKMQISQQSFRLFGEKADLIGQVVYCSSGEMKLSQHNYFEDVDPAEIEGLPSHWHLSAETPAAKSHRMAVMLVPMKKTEQKLVNFFVDDQDHGVHLYFTEHGVTNRVEILKVY